MTNTPSSNDEPPYQPDDLELRRRASIKTLEHERFLRPNTFNPSDSAILMLADVGARGYMDPAVLIWHAAEHLKKYEGSRMKPEETTALIGRRRKTITSAMIPHITDPRLMLEIYEGRDVPKPSSRAPGETPEMMLAKANEASWQRLQAAKKKPR